MDTLNLVVNRAARSGREARDLPALCVLAAERGLRLALHEPVDRTETRDLLAQLSTHEERVVVMGGDGMANLAADALAGSACVLGLIPSGTGNDFAAALGLAGRDLPCRLARALAPPCRIDLLATPSGHVASVATAGFSVDVNRAADRLRLGPLRSQRYTVATLLRLPRLRPRPIELRLADGQVELTEAVLVAVANTALFGGGMRICPGADPTDGLADVTVVGPVGRLELLRFFRLVFSGRHVDHPAVRTFRSRSVDLGGRTGEIWADGEPLAEGPLHLEIRPGALLVAGADPGGAGGCDPPGEAHEGVAP